MIVRKFHIKYTEKVAKLIRETYLNFNKKEGSKKAVENYASWYDPNKIGLKELQNKFNKTPIFYVAIDNNKIIGMVRGVKDRVINLYVAGKYHGKGTGKKLMEKFEKDCKKFGSKEIKIKSSLYAVKFYEKLGYKKTTGIKIGFNSIKGLKYQPMRKILK